MQDYTEPSLNKRIREKAIRNESLDRNTEKNVKRSAVFREAELHSAKFRVSAFSSSTTQDVSNRVQKWNVGLERRKERETFCGRLRKRTPFLRWRAQLQGCEAERQKLRMSSQCEVILLRRLSPAQFIRLS